MIPDPFHSALPPPSRTITYSRRCTVTPTRIEPIHAFPLLKKPKVPPHSFSTSKHRVNVPSFLQFRSCEETYDDGNIKEGYYTCVRESASGLYCEAWTGDVESPEELEVASCECSETWNGDGMCSFWTCKERWLDKCTLCNLTVAIIVFGLFGMVGVLCCASGVWTGSWAVALFGTLWACMFAPGVVILGGQDGCMYVGIAWAGFLALVYLLRCVTSTFKPRDISTLSIIPAQ